MKFEKLRVAATSPRFSIGVSLRGNVGKSETAKFLEPLGGHVQPGDAPGGLPGPAWWPSGALLKASRSLPGSQNPPTLKGVRALNRPKEKFTSP